MLLHTRVIAGQLLGQAALGRVTGSGPRLVVVSGPDAGRSLPISDGDTVGRGDAAQVPLRDPAASRQHLRIDGRGGALAILDLGSKNGVEVNGRRVRGRAALRDGDRVRVGVTVLEAVALPDPAVVLPDPAVASPSSLVPGARLLRASAAMLLAAGAALVAAGL